MSSATEGVVVPESPPPPTLHVAELAPGPSGAVLYGSEISFDAAVRSRRAGLDVVVRGVDADANRRLAQRIETAVGPPSRPQAPERRAGPMALPHFHQQSREPPRTPLLRDREPQGQETIMKYFTPELIHAYGSDDPAIWREAERHWDAACIAYAAHLDALKPAFPPGLQRLEEHYNLHDAVVRGMGRHDGKLVIMVQLDRPPQPLLILGYDLAGEPQIREEVLPTEDRSSGSQVDWQHDEIEQTSGASPTWKHTILLSNGWKVVVPFRDVQVDEVEAVLPSPGPAVSQSPVDAMPHPV